VHPVCLILGVARRESVVGDPDGHKAGPERVGVAVSVRFERVAVTVNLPAVDLETPRWMRCR
jgi:hypothetical protein